MKLKLKVGDELFAVTDQDVIIPLIIVGLDSSKVEGSVYISTEMNIDVKKNTYGHELAHYESYFKNMWLHEELDYIKPSVFTDRKAAIKYALRHSSDAVRLAKSRFESKKATHRLLEKEYEENN